MQRTTVIKLAALPIAAALATGGLVIASAASADTSADPVTGGTTTISVSVKTVKQLAKAGIVAVPETPATVTYDPATSNVEYALPVTGGDASVNTFFGTLKHGGSLLLINACKHRSATITDITFDIETDTISGTPAGSSTPVVLFDALGTHDYSVSPQPETFSSDDLEIDPAGAKYLNGALRTRIFKGTQHIGTFTTSFSNTVDAG